MAGGEGRKAYGEKWKRNTTLHHITIPPEMDKQD